MPSGGEGSGRCSVCRLGWTGRSPPVPGPRDAAALAILAQDAKEPLQTWCSPPTGRGSQSSQRAGPASDGNHMSIGKKDQGAGDRSHNSEGMGWASPKKDLGFTETFVKSSVREH